MTNLKRFGRDKILFKPEASPIGPHVSALRDATGGEARIFEGSGRICLVDSFRRGIAQTMLGMEFLPGIVAIWKRLCTTNRRRQPNAWSLDEEPRAELDRLLDRPDRAVKLAANGSAS